MIEAAEERRAREFIERADFLWHQRFRLAGDVFTPGDNDVDWLAAKTGLPEDLNGKSVLDVGTTNGGAAFEAERRGASRVVAVDIVDRSMFGFDAIAGLLGSKAEFVQANVYDLAALLDEQFDVVVFWGVLYHLRHPLLGLDNVRACTGDLLLLETAIADAELPPAARSMALARFYPRDELKGDRSNWFTPTAVALEQWCRSAGLEPEETSSWPRAAPTRCAVRARRTPDDPEYAGVIGEHDRRGPLRR